MMQVPVSAQKVTIAKTGVSTEMNIHDLTIEGRGMVQTVLAEWRNSS